MGLENDVTESNEELLDLEDLGLSYEDMEDLPSEESWSINFADTFNYEESKPEGANAYFVSKDRDEVIYLQLDKNNYQELHKLR